MKLKRCFFMLAIMIMPCGVYGSVPQEQKEKEADLKYAKKQKWLLKLPCAKTLKAVLEQHFCDFVAKTNIHETLADKELLPITVASHIELALLDYSKKTPDKRTVAHLNRRKKQIIVIIEQHSTVA